MVLPPAQRAPSDQPGAEFGAELRRLRRTRGLSLAALAARVHYSAGQLSKIENGRARPTRALAEACDKALEAGGSLARLVTPRPRGRSLPASLARPVDLPPPTGIFVGRDKELATIVELLAPEPRGAARIVVVHGPPGAGKTQLAILAADRLLDRYPDGCIFLDLRGAGVPIDAYDAMDRLLRRLGVPAETIPGDPGEREALYRQVMRGRRLLLVLDNPPGARDVLALVAPGGASGVLVASRSPLKALDEATVVRVRPLSMSDARALFVRVAGDRLSAGDADAVVIDRITTACARLPLLIRIAAARFRSSHRLTLQSLADRVRYPDGTLATLDDGTRSVTRMFADACSALPPEQARLFALLSLHPGDTFDPWSASLLTGGPESEAEQWLDGLLDACMIEPAAADRYAFHDLVRAAAAQQAGTILSPSETSAARARLLAGYLVRAQQADVAVTPSRHRQPPVRPPAAAGSPFDTAASAIAWLESEQDTLVRLVEQAAANGEYGTCWRLAYALRDHFFRTVAGRVWRHTHTVALSAARAADDPWAVAVTLNDLGLACVMDGDRAVAEEHYTEALRLFRALKDPYGEANALGHLAWTAYLRGDYAGARDRSVEALAIYRQRGAIRNEAITLRTLALAQNALGHADEAMAHLLSAVPMFVANGLVLDEAMALNSLGEVSGPRDAGESLRYHIRAWWRARACGSVAEQVRALRGMARAATALGRSGSAARLSAYAARLSGVASRAAARG